MNQTASMSVQLIGDREVAMTRTLNAPRDLVFRAFSDAEQLKQWWGPDQFTLPYCTVNFRPGGTWLYCMRGPDGQDYWGKAVYQEIEPPARIVYMDAFADEHGNETSPPMQITVTFEESAGRTTISMRTLFATAAERETVMATGMKEGLCQTFDRLEALLAQVA